MLKTLSDGLLEQESDSDKDTYRAINARLHRSDVLFETSDKEITLNLHAGQMRAWDSEERTVAMIAGTQGGKTSFGPWWLAREIKRCGAGDYIAATASFDLFKLKMLPAMREVFEYILKIGRYWSGDKIIELMNPETGKFEAERADDPMWGRIILRSAVAKGGLESSTANAAWLDEAGQDEFELSAYEAIKRRLALKRGRKLITTTPYNLGWIKQQVSDKDGQDVEVINFDSTENPLFPIEEFQEAEKDMAPWKFKMFYRGLFDKPPGMIYNDFIDEYRERGGHKIKPFPVPIEWPRFVGVDPGVINTCKVWLAHNPIEDYYVLYRESLGERKSAKEHAQDAVALAKQGNERVVRWAVGAKSEIYHREDWIAGGAVGVVGPAVNDVEARIDQVITLFRAFKLFIFDTCTGTLDQIGTYSRKIDKLGQLTDEIKDKEKYHYLDALGYIALSIGKNRGPRKAEVVRYA